MLGMPCCPYPCWPYCPDCDMASPPYCITGDAARAVLDGKRRGVRPQLTPLRRAGKEARSVASMAGWCRGGKSSSGPTPTPTSDDRRSIRTVVHLHPQSVALSVRSFSPREFVYDPAYKRVACRRGRGLVIVVLRSDSERRGGRLRSGTPPAGRARSLVRAMVRTDLSLGVPLSPRNPRLGVSLHEPSRASPAVHFAASRAPRAPPLSHTRTEGWPSSTRTASRHPA